MVELLLLILCTRVSTLLHTLLCCFTLYITFRGYTAQTLTEPQWGLTFWFFSWLGSCTRTNILWSATPPKIHHRDYINGVPIHARNCLCLTSMMVQVECLHTVLCPRMLYRPTMRCRPSYERHWEWCYFAVVQNSNTSMGVGSLLCLHSALVEWAGPGQAGTCHLPGLGWPAQ